MANKYTEAQKRATYNYQKDKVKIQLLVSPEQREQYRKDAEALNMSLSQYIISKLEEA